MSMPPVGHSFDRSAASAGPTPAHTRTDWARIVERLLAGDRAAQLRIARLVTGFLARWGAYDFRPEWPDLVQDVLLALVRAAREGRIARPEALVGYLRSIARHKLMDRLRARARRAEEASAPCRDATSRRSGAEACAHADQDLVADLHCALERLPERKRRAIVAVYAEGLSYEQAAALTGTPLGTLKRHLREGIAELRRDFSIGLERDRSGPSRCADSNQG